MSWGGVWGFGRPYSPACVYTIGLIIAAGLSPIFLGLIVWIEKLFMILSMLRLTCEYFFIGIRHWKKTNQKKKITFLLWTIFVFFIIFLIISSFIYNHI
jgi:hypothetical protein